MTLAFVGSAAAFLPSIGTPTAVTRPKPWPAARPTRIPQALALAPSGVDGLPAAVQASAFCATLSALGASAFSIDRAYQAARRWRPGWAWDAWEIATALLLGAIFITAGRSHFVLPDAFIAIYPPQGTWGFWNLPGSAEFHVAWTGVAELSGGSGLLLGGLIDAASLAGISSGLGSARLLPVAARSLFLLVLCVTPANFYM